MGQQSVHHGARTQRPGAQPEIVRPPRPASWRERRRRIRACRRQLGHCWHPAGGMVDWWCCECSAETDGNPPQRCRRCNPHQLPWDVGGRRIETIPPTVDRPHPPPPPPGPDRVRVEQSPLLDAVQQTAQELRERYQASFGDQLHPVASDHHVEMLCAVAANMPVPDRLIHLTDPERALAGWKANMRQYADQVAAEAWHAGAAWGLARQAPGRYVVVTEEEYERIRTVNTEAVSDWVRRVALAEDRAIAAAAERATQLGAGVRVRHTPERLIIAIDPDVPVGEVHIHEGLS